MQKAKNFSALIKGNAYPGRGIIIGKTPKGDKAAVAYFITGRSENSRNRRFVLKGSDLYTEPLDKSKVKNPELIIYRAIAKINGGLVVSNGDHTDTVCEFLKDGKDFRSALLTREFEPDAPNFTPRISGILDFGKEFSYRMAILKRGEGKEGKCLRYFFDYPSEKGEGRFISTYDKNGDPLPSFSGEPERVFISDDINEFSNEVWESLDFENKIALHVRYIDLLTGEAKYINFNKTDGKAK